MGESSNANGKDLNDFPHFFQWSLGGLTPERLRIFFCWSQGWDLKTGRFDKPKPTVDYELWWYSGSSLIGWNSKGFFYMVSPGEMKKKASCWRSLTPWYISAMLKKKLVSNCVWGDRLIVKSSWTMSIYHFLSFFRHSLWWWSPFGEGTGHFWGPCARRSVGSTASNRRKGASFFIGEKAVLVWSWVEKTAWYSWVLKLSIDTFDGFWRNPAITSWKKVNFPWPIAGFHTCQVVQDFFHQQYAGDREQEMMFFFLQKMLLIYFGYSVGVGLCKYFQVPYTLWKINGWNFSS